MLDKCLFDLYVDVFIFYLLLIVFVFWQNGDTPLYCAAYRGHLSVVQLLLSAHAVVNQADKVSESKVSKLYYSLA